MNSSYAVRSLLVFVISVIFLIIITLADPILAGTSTSLQRLLTVLLLVLTPATGVWLGVLGLIRKDGKARLAVLSAIANTLFALFHLALVFFAG